MKLYKLVIVFVLCIIGVVIIGSGKLREFSWGHCIYVGDRCMARQDYLAALGYYEKILGSDSGHVVAHLRAAAALDSMVRPIEAGWHYDAVAKKTKNVLP
jgi:hypothetical protein